ncbi:hypothetical protein D3C72_1150710 [compost metagenome]
MAPDSNSPSWLLAPMKIELTALTRPRMASGVSSCTSVWRITTLTMSAPPDTASAMSETRKLFDSPNTTMHSPNAPTASSSVRPTLRSTGRRVSAIDITSAPTAGALRSRPRPQGPVCRMSLA